MILLAIRAGLSDEHDIAADFSGVALGTSEGGSTFPFGERRRHVASVRLCRLRLDLQVVCRWLCPGQMNGKYEILHLINIPSVIWPHVGDEAGTSLGGKG